MKYNFYIVYLGFTGAGSVTGQIAIDRDKDIKTYKDILEVAQCLQDHFGFQKVIVLNYVKLESEGME